MGRHLREGAREALEERRKRKKGWGKTKHYDRSGSNRTNWEKKSVKTSVEKRGGLN